MSDKFEKIKEEWEKFCKNNDCVNDANSEYNNFKEKFPKDEVQGGTDKPICNGIVNLTLDQYTNLLPNEYFTNWVERETKACGSLGATYSRYGIKRNAPSAPESYKNTSDNQDFNDKTSAEAYFTSTILPQIKMLVCFEDNYMINNEHKSTLTMDIRFARKVAYLYNPHKLLPIFKNDVIEAMAEFFDVEVDLKSYKATEPLLNAICNVFSIRQTDFKITQKLMQFLYEKFANSFPLELNMVLHGAPGTGKTFQVTKTVENLIEISGGDINEQMMIVQFHPSYGYEEFIDGIKPKGISNGSVNLALVNGEFKKMCKKAFENLKSKDETTKNYYFIADEINRAELSRVFGEVLLCIEKDKRLRFKKKKLEGMKVKTQNASLWTDDDAIVVEGEGNKKELFFGIPENLYFIGTMNDIDRSVDSFDMALRRRFVWKEMRCDYSLIDNEDYRECCQALNDYIINLPELGSSFELGHGYFMDIKVSDLKKENLWKMRIQPLLKEYLRASYSQQDIEKHLKTAQNKFMCKEEKTKSTKKGKQTKANTIEVEDGDDNKNS